MCIKKLVALFLLITLAGRIAIAEDVIPEFTRLSEGQNAPFDGYLFTPAAIARVVSTGEEGRRKAVAKCQNETEIIRLDLRKETERRTVELTAKDRLLKDMIEIKDKQIREREDKISLLEGDKVFSNVLIISSFLAGAALTAGVVYITAGALK